MPLEGKSQKKQFHVQEGSLKKGIPRRFHSKQLAKLPVEKEPLNGLSTILLEV